MEITPDKSRLEYRCARHIPNPIEQKEVLRYSLYKIFNTFFAMGVVGMLPGYYIRSEWKRGLRAWRSRLGGHLDRETQFLVKFFAVGVPSVAYLWIGLKIMQKRLLRGLDNGYYAAWVYMSRHPDVILVQHAANWHCNCGAFLSTTRAEYRSAVIKSLLLGQKLTVPDLKCEVPLDIILKAPTYFKALLYYNLTMSELIETEYSTLTCLEATEQKCANLRLACQMEEDPSPLQDTPSSPPAEQQQQREKMTKFNLTEWDKIKAGKSETGWKNILEVESSRRNPTKKDLKRREWLKDCIVADHPNGWLQPIQVSHQKYTRAGSFARLDLAKRQKLYAILQNKRPPKHLTTCLRETSPSLPPPSATCHHSLGVENTLPSDVHLNTSLETDSQQDRRRRAMREWLEPQEVKPRLIEEGRGSYAWWREQSQRDFVELLKRDGNTCVSARQRDSSHWEMAHHSTWQSGNLDMVPGNAWQIGDLEMAVRTWQIQELDERYHSSLPGQGREPQGEGEGQEMPEQNQGDTDRNTGKIRKDEQRKVKKNMYGDIIEDARQYERQSRNHPPREQSRYRILEAWQ